MTRNVEQKLPPYRRTATVPSFWENLPTRLIALRKMQKEAATRLDALAEILADRTCRVGLFAEDADCPHAGLDAEYLSEDALELKYCEPEALGVPCKKGAYKSSIPRVFNGF